ncbi:MAG TPA: CAP domain-containing protein [Bacteroidia bacterium]|jgi:uncharacterized protein YkwD|nr:CAP domain-containing protein [Bacteroidia bacterium]
MRTKAIICLLLFGRLFVQAQQPDKALLEICNTAKEAGYLSDDEKRVVVYLNLARAYPDEFLNYYLKEAAEKLNQASSASYHSLLKELKNHKALPLLQPNKELWQIAMAHAQDMGKSGKMGHTSSKGKTFDQRSASFNMKKAENCDYGNSEPLLIVTDLLIDDKVASLGHRKNILTPDFKQCGVSIQPHKKYTVNCVMDFVP